MVQSAVFWILLISSATAFWMLPKRMRYGFVAVVSLVYLFILAPLSIVPMLGLALISFWLAPYAVVNRRKKENSAEMLLIPLHDESGVVAPTHLFAPRVAKLILFFLITVNLLYLILFKYIAPLVPASARVASSLQQGSVTVKVIVPLGISYFTFKLIHYLIEVSRGNITDRSLARFLGYVFVFPAFPAGPIERFDHFLSHLQDRPMIAEGVRRIIHGLIKKFVFADLCLGGYFRDANAKSLLLSLGHTQTVDVWKLLIASYLYIYMDFSGYTDLALGACQLFGIRLMENFNFPILAVNIAAFWKRWHITLANWCQSYVFMPMLGWTRNVYVAIYATFVSIGLWHAASLNWFFWGVYHATGIIIYQQWSQWKRRRNWKFSDHSFSRPAAIALTFLFVSVGMIFTLDSIATSHDLLRVAAKLVWIRIS